MSRVDKNFGLPQSTIFNRIVNKEHFEGLANDTNIKRIRWLGKIGPSTLNITATEEIPELEVMMVLFNDTINEAVLKKVDKTIPNKLVLIYGIDDLLHFGVFIDNKLLQVPLNKELSVQGNSTNEIYYNFIRQIMYNRVGELQETSRQIKEEFEAYRECQAVQNQIEQLNKRIQKQPQANKRQELARKRYQLEQKLKELGAR